MSLERHGIGSLFAYIISLSAKLLDDKRYAEFIELLVEDGAYVLEAESDEIGHRMIWLETSRDELATLLEEAPQHVHDLAARTHLVSVDNITLNRAADSAEVQSTFAVFRTDTTGNTQIYAVGRYNDKLICHGGDWRIRNVVCSYKLACSGRPHPHLSRI